MDIQADSAIVALEGQTEIATSIVEDAVESAETAIEIAVERADEAQETAQQIADAAMATALGQRITEVESSWNTFRNDADDRLRTVTSSLETLQSQLTEFLSVQALTKPAETAAAETLSILPQSDEIAEAIADPLDLSPVVVEDPQVPKLQRVRRAI